MATSSERFSKRIKGLFYPLIGVIIIFSAGCTAFMKGAETSDTSCVIHKAYLVEIKQAKKEIDRRKITISNYVIPMLNYHKKVCSE